MLTDTEHIFGFQNVAPVVSNKVAPSPARSSRSTAWASDQRLADFGPSSSLIAAGMQTVVTTTPPTTAIVTLRRAANAGRAESTKPCAKTPI